MGDRSAPLTYERETWAVASTLMRIHGDDAPRWVAERIAALALAGECAGVERFMEIADRMDKLMRPDVIQ